MYKELCSRKLLWILKENSEIVPSSCYIYIGSVFISLTSSCLDELENIAGLLIIKALEKKQPLKYLAFWSKHQPTWRKSKEVPTCCMLKYFRYNSFDVHSLFFHKRLKRLMCMAEATLLSLGEALDSTLDLIPQGKAGAGSVLQISDLLKLRCRMIYKSKRRMRGTIVCYLMNSVGLDTLWWWRQLTWSYSNASFSAFSGQKLCFFSIFLASCIHLTFLGPLYPEISSFF